MDAYRRDLLGKVNILGELHLALLERTFQVCFLDRLARIRILVDQSNEIVVSDRKVHLGALFDLLLEVSLGGNAKSLAPAIMELANGSVVRAKTKH